MTAAPAGAGLGRAGTRLPSLGHIGYQPLEDALAVQCAGLIDSGVGMSSSRPARTRCRSRPANGKRARDDAHKDADPRQVTIETTGTLLVGADIAAAASSSTRSTCRLSASMRDRPARDGRHVKWLGENWPGHL
jgi:5-methyltetrahydrofolate--homocysteine methyltransferase